MSKRRSSNRYRSKFERTVASVLTSNKVKFNYEALKIPYKYPVRCDPCPKCGHDEHYVSRNYISDFSFRQDTLILELKGKLDREDRKKYAALLESNPKLNIRFMFQRNNRILPRSEIRYSDWATKLGVPYCVGELPKEWIKEFKNGV